MFEPKIKTLGYPLNGNLLTSTFISFHPIVLRSILLILWTLDSSPVVPRVGKLGFHLWVINGGGGAFPEKKTRQGKVKNGIRICEKKKRNVSGSRKLKSKQNPYRKSRYSECIVPALIIKEETLILRCVECERRRRRVPKSNKLVSVPRKIVKLAFYTLKALRQFVSLQTKPKTFFAENNRKTPT